MKRTINYIIIACVSFITFSCTTKQKFTVYGKPGTLIYKPNMSHVATIQNNGRVKVKLDSDNYYAYLLSRDANSERVIPFALDYKNKSYTGKRIIAGTAYMLLGASLGAEIAGVAAYSGGNKDIAGTFVLAGLGLAVLGLAPACADEQLNQTPESYKFKYLPSQTTNQNVVFTDYIENGQIKGSIKDENSSPANHKHVQQNNNQKSTQATSISVAKIKSSKSTRTLKDYGKIVEGNYIGEGKLLQGEETIEDYKRIKVSLMRVDKNTVAVNVYDDNNEAFFLKNSNYNIKKTKANEYTMSLDDIPSAIIVINDKNNLIYIHPRVNIDGSMYTLEISAIRK